MSKQPRKPRIVKLKEKQTDLSSAKNRVQQGKAARKPKAHTDLSVVIRQNEEMTDQLEVPPSRPVKTGFSWGKLFLGALAGLVSLGIWLAVDQLIRDLFERQTWLGWSAVALAATLGLAMFGILLREIWGISRLNTIAGIRKKAMAVQSGERPGGGENVVKELESIYFDRPDLASSRAGFDDDRGAIFDSDDLITLFEKKYMAPLDETAKKLVMQSAKRVSVVTAISPRAIVDIVYVLMENTRLIRRISNLYGGKPGALGFWKLTRNVLGHLAVTGTIAAGDSLIQQLVGHGIAARLSAKLGEGIVNGLLTARIGLAAIDQARPLEFKSLPRPGISEFFTELSRSVSNSEN